MTLLDPEFFLFVFLLVPAYWLTPRDYRLQSLALLSYIGLAYFSVISALSLALMSLLGYVCAVNIARSKHFFTAGFFGLLAIFACYKLYSPSGSGQTALLIGMSFYLLKALHVLIESYKGRLRISSPGLFLSYMAFFPTLLIGPIHRHEDFSRDWMRQSFNKGSFSLGLERCLLGYAKLVILASLLGERELSKLIVALGNDSPRLTEYLESLGYGLHLYFSFAGASDIAIGISLMLGYRMVENFNAPFLSLDIADFWRRWHISLGNWCREYIYGTIVSVSRRHQVGIFLTMLGIGLWHEFSARYVLWGCYHGLGLLVYYRWSGLTSSWLEQHFSTTAASYVHRVLAWFITFNFVVVGFTITRSESLAGMASNFQGLFFGG